MSKAEKIVESLMEKIDSATEPSKMSKGAALDVLEEIRSQLDGRIEALKEEMEDG